MKLALLGDRDLDFVTHRALDAALAQMPAGVDAGWIATDSPQARSLDVDALWIAPGTPYRDDEAVYAAIRRAREEGIPLLGTCGGFQYVVVEFARNVAGIDAAHAESDPDADEPVIERLVCSLYGEERTVVPVPGTRIAELCGAAPFPGFLFCGFGLAPQFVRPLARAGLPIGAHAADAGVEAVELRDHPFFVATLFQPQMGALDGAPPHPLIETLLAA